MYPEIKQQWTTALRSGEDQQGKHFLRCGDKFCCLGILCDLHARITGIQWANEGYYLGLQSVLPPEVQAWAGLDSKDPEVDVGKLSELNDAGKTFGEISDVIEEHL